MCELSKLHQYKSNRKLLQTNERSDETNRYFRICDIDKGGKVVDHGLKWINLWIQGFPSSLQNINSLFGSSVCIIPFSQKNLITKNKKTLTKKLEKKMHIQFNQRGKKRTINSLVWIKQPGKNAAFPNGTWEPNFKLLNFFTKGNQNRRKSIEIARIDLPWHHERVVREVSGRGWQGCCCRQQNVVGHEALCSFRQWHLGIV